MQIFGSIAQKCTTSLTKPLLKFVLKRFFARNEENKVKSFDYLVHFAAPTALNTITSLKRTVSTSEHAPVFDEPSLEKEKKKVLHILIKFFTTLDPVNNEEVRKRIPLFASIVASQYIDTKKPTFEELQKCNYTDVSTRENESIYFKEWQKQCPDFRKILSKYYRQSGNWISIDEFCILANEGINNNKNELEYLPIKENSDSKARSVEGIEVKYKGADHSNTTVFLFSQSTKLSRTNLEHASNIVKYNKCDVIMMDSLSMGDKCATFYKLYNHHFRSSLDKETYKQFKSEFRTVPPDKEFDKYKECVLDRVKRVLQDNPSQKIIFTGNLFDATLATYMAVAAQAKEEDNKNIHLYITNPISSISDVIANLDACKILNCKDFFVNSFALALPLKYVSKRLREYESQDNLYCSIPELLVQISPERQKIDYFCVKEQKQIFGKSYLGVDSSYPEREPKFEYDNFNCLLPGLNRYIKEIIESERLKTLSANKDGTNIRRRSLERIVDKSKLNPISLSQSYIKQKSEYVM